MTSEYFSWSLILSSFSLFCFIWAGNGAIMSHYKRYQLSEDEFFKTLGKLKGVNALWNVSSAPIRKLEAQAIHPFFSLGIVAFIVAPFMLLTAFINRQYLDFLAALVVLLVYLGLMLIAFKVPSSIFGNKLKPRTDKSKISQ